MTTHFTIHSLLGCVMIYKNEIIFIFIFLDYEKKLMRLKKYDDVEYAYYGLLIFIMMLNMVIMR
jgi:hypothetical protein